MAITPDEIENRVFSLVRRGYEPTEVDDFLKEVASTLAQAQGGLATPAPADTAADTATDVTSPDDFGRLGDEVAAILRQAHESVATLRHRAEADAALIRQRAEQEADALRGEADADRQQAAQIREAAEADAAARLAEVEQRIDAAAESAAEQARARAREAVIVQRNVRGRLEGTRGDLDTALGRLAVEDEDLFPTIDLTDAALAEAGATPEDDVPPPGQGPPSPPVPPPGGSSVDLTDLPYADEGEVDETEDSEADAESGDEAGDEAATEGAPEASTAEEDDPLAAMVRNAVENALRRRKSDQDPPEDG